MSGLLQTLESLRRAFKRLGLRWYVFGAQAAIFHGVDRATADVDVTVEPRKQTSQAIMKALEREGFELAVSADRNFLDLTRVIPLIHRKSGVPVDVVLAGPGLEELFFERVIYRDVAGVSGPVPIASAEDLIVMKILAGRDKDLADVKTLLSRQITPINLARVRTDLRTLEEVLGQSDLLPPFDELVRSVRKAKPKVTRSRSGPAPKPKPKKTKAEKLQGPTAARRTKTRL